MTDFQKWSIIESATHGYLHHSTQKARIRHCALNLASKGEKTDLDFDVLVGEYKARILRAQVLKTLDTSKNPYRANRNPCWVVPFERNAKFVDCEYLEKIKRKIFAKDRSGMITVYGLGGAGKTQIALELAYQTKEFYPDCAVVWIPAVDMESLQQAYHQVARQLGLDYAEAEEEDVKSVVQRYFSQPQSGRWLLIYDNADELDMWTQGTQETNHAGLKGFLPRSQQDLTLFTTRSSRVANYLTCHDIVGISSMDEHKAMKVLKNSLISKDLLKDVESTRQLLERLTYLPLATVQAASFMNENLTDIKTYSRLLDGQEQDVVDLLSVEFEDEGRYQTTGNPVATTWLTSFTQIQRHHPLAAQYLSFMACINAKDILMTLLPPATELEKQKAIGVLCSYAFLRIHHNGSRCDMHRLVHLTTRNWLRSTNTLSNCQAAALQQVAASYPYELGTSNWRTAIPHALRILELTCNETELAPTSSRAVLLQVTANSKWADGKPKDAEELFRQAVHFAEKAFGAEDFRTLKSRADLAHTMLAQGCCPETAEVFEELLEIHKRAHGTDSPFTIAATADVAKTCNIRGAFRRAVELGAQVVRFHLQTVGVAHRSTLRAMTDMTMIYLRQGRLVDGNAMAMQELAIQRLYYPPDDPRIIWTLFSLASISMRRFRLKRAEALFREGLEKARKTIGPEHPAVIWNTELLALVLKYQNRHSEAIELMTETARLHEAAFGASHPTNVRLYSWIETWNNRHWTERFRNINNLWDKYDWMKQRRRTWPRIKVWGGLYRGKRRPKDSSLVLEIQRAIDAFSVGRQVSSDEMTLVDSGGNGGITDEI